MTRVRRAGWLACCLAGCPSAAPPSARSELSQAGTSGTLNLQLTLSDIAVDEVRYTVTQGLKLEREGRFVVDAQTSLRAVLGALPAGVDLVLDLSATARRRDTGASTKCVASDTFSIVAGQTTMLALMMQCDASPSAANDDTNMCPVISAIRAIPAEAPLGSEVVVKADVTDVDQGPERLHYAWSADSGSFTDATSSRAGFMCTEIGIATVSLAVSDGDPMCQRDPVLVYVTCDDADTSGSSFNMGDAGGASAGAGGAAAPAAMGGGAAMSPSVGSAGTTNASGAAGSSMPTAGLGASAGSAAAAGAAGKTPVAGSVAMDAAGSGSVANSVLVAIAGRLRSLSKGRK